jgi:D-alanyl-D-alanine carboxypeptidase/D-alanyl-D-alanine-endopeptidase (penicillin-binding protein 4)
MPVSSLIPCLLAGAVALIGPWTAVRAEGLPAASAQPPTPAAPPAGLPDTVRLALARAGVPLEAVSVGVWPAEGGSARVAHLDGVVRQPASLMKLFTTGVALRRLGPAWTWRTEVGLGGPLQPDGRLAGPLYVRGQGDPALVLERLDALLARWRAAGLTQVDGDIVLDRQAFALPLHDPAAFDGQALKPYNGGPDALLLAHGAVTLRLRPDAARPGWARVDLSPPLDGVQLRADVPLGEGPCGDWRQAMAVSMAQGGDTAVLPAPVGTVPLTSWTVTLQGRYPASCGERDWPVLWPADDDHSARLLASRWRTAGGALMGRVRAGAWPAGLPVWQTWASPPLGEVVRDINKFSNNVMARQLFLTLGRAPTPDAPPASADSARQVVTEAVRGTTREAGQDTGPCDGEALLLDNGSGLSRRERSTAACLGRWLQQMWVAPTMPEFLASLPVAGLDGTARRLRGVTGQAHLKTGSLDGVASIAGVVSRDDGRRLVVVFLVNHARAEAARPAFDELLLWARATPM